MAFEQVLRHPRPPAGPFHDPPQRVPPSKYDTSVDHFSAPPRGRAKSRMHAIGHVDVFLNTRAPASCWRRLPGKSQYGVSSMWPRTSLPGGDHSEEGSFVPARREVHCFGTPDRTRFRGRPSPRLTSRRTRPRLATDTWTQLTRNEPCAQAEPSAVPEPRPRVPAGRGRPTSLPPTPQDQAETLAAEAAGPQADTLTADARALSRRARPMRQGQ